MPEALTPSAAALLLALAWDALLGEPTARLHPVVWIGRVVGAAVRRAPAGGRARELAYGAALALLVPAAFALGAWGVLALLEPLPWLRLAVEAWALKSTFALRALREAALLVRRQLAAGDVAGARHDLRSLCSRDASTLDERQLAAATVESVAENTSDSFVAPLLAYVVLGLPGALLYRAVNTLDAMVGYHGRFEYLGKASARLDDALNYVPARLTAWLLLAAGWLRGFDARAAVRILARDGASTESPNAGRPMAAMAGLLGVVLDKAGHYRLGDARNELTLATIDQAWRLTVVASAAAVLLALACLGLRHAVAR